MMLFSSLQNLFGICGGLWNVNYYMALNTISLLCFMLSLYIQKLSVCFCVSLHLYQGTESQTDLGTKIGLDLILILIFYIYIYIEHSSSGWVRLRPAMFSSSLSFCLGLSVIIRSIMMWFGGVWKSGGLKVYWMKDCQHLNEREIWHLKLRVRFLCSKKNVLRLAFQCVGEWAEPTPPPC